MTIRPNTQRGGFTVDLHLDGRRVRKLCASKKEARETEARLLRELRDSAQEEAARLRRQVSDMDTQLREKDQVGGTCGAPRRSRGALRGCRPCCAPRLGP